jgi:hypothetical protein
VRLEAGEQLAREALGRGRRDGDADAEPASFVDDLEEILTLERVSAGENEMRQRVGELGNLAQKRGAFIEGELVAAGFGLRRGNVGRLVRTPGSFQYKLRGVWV